MKRILSLIFSIMFVLPLFSFIGCAETEEAKVLRICNCEDYIDEELLTKFTEETGIIVEYSTYGTNENLYNELVINPNSYDLVVPSEYMIEKLAVEGRIQPLTKKSEYESYLSSYNANISPFIKEKLKNIEIDEGKYKNENLTLYDFMVGYMWGTMGWVYNTKNVDVEDVKNWYSPFKNSNLNGKITIKDAVRDSYIVGLAMVYEEELYGAKNDNAKLTEILNRTDKESIEKVGSKLFSLKNKLYGFEVDSGKNDIVLGNIDAYVAWSGDAAYAIDVASGEVEDDDGSFLKDTKELSYYIPEEGSNIWFDGFVMPSASTNYEAVYKFLEFISSSSSVYSNMNYTGYTSMIAKGDDFELEDEEENTYTTNLFDEVVLGLFDKTESLLAKAKKTDLSQVSIDEMEELGYKLVDLSYFFGSGDYKVVVSEESYGRLIAQYPTEEIVQRCAIMSYFDGETLLDINDMWLSVKCETFPLWIILLTVGIVLLLATTILLYRFRDKVKIFKFEIKEKDYAKKHNLKVVKKEKLN